MMEKIGTPTDLLFDQIEFLNREMMILGEQRHILLRLVTELEDELSESSKEKVRKSLESLGDVAAQVDAHLAALEPSEEEPGI